MSLDDRVAEVIEASTTAFTAQCYELYGLPALGSLVKTGGEGAEIYAVVANALTAGLEPGRRSIARGREEPSEADVYKTNPQLAKLLHSEFHAVVVGYREQGQIWHHLPPRPARIHGFVYACSTGEIREFSHSLKFLSIVANYSGDVPADELAAAVLRRMAAAHEDSGAFLLAAGRELALLLAGRYDQLKSVLGRLR